MYRSLRLIPRTRFCTWVAFVGLGLGVMGLASAEEPYEKFLRKLRDEQLYDLALVYLDGLEKQSGISPEVKADFEFERGLLIYQSAAMLPPSNPARESKMNDAERSLRDFLDQKKNHPRRGEARLKLGELLLVRADAAKTAQGGGEVATDNLAAIKFYDDAHKLFEETIAELAGIVERIKGARTDASDAARVAFRTKVLQDLRQAQLLSAKAVEDRGRSRAEASTERKADLERALAMFSDLYSKERDMVGIRNYALFYRSAIQVTLGKIDDAIDGFQRIADQENIDVLRPLQTNAITELVKLFGQQAKFPLAVDRADKWIGALRPDEKGSADALSLKLELSKLKILWAEQLKKQDPDDRVSARLVRDTRNELRTMLRTPGRHLEETQKLLASLGVEKIAAQSTELPKVKDFGEALAAAQERMEQAENGGLDEDSVNAARDQTVLLLNQAMRLYRASDDRGLLSDAHLLLAYTLVHQQKPWDALAIAEFLATSNPNTEKGLRAAAITLGALGDLLKTASETEKIELTAHLEPFAEYLVSTWPKSSEANIAAAALVQLSLATNQWEKVDRFLAMVPETGETSQKLRREAGSSLYRAYLIEKKAAGNEENESTTALKSRAMVSLQTGLAGLTGKDLDEAASDAVNHLVRLYLLDERIDEAATLLFSSDLSPLKALQSKPDVLPVKSAMESYRTALQVVISQLAEGKLESSKALAQTQDIVSKLQSLALTDSAVSTNLPDFFVRLTQDLKEKLAASTDAQKRKRLSEALVLVAAEAGKSEAFNSQYWAADTIISVAQELLNEPAAKAMVQPALVDAVQILDRILAKEKSQPGWIQPEGFQIQIKLLSAKAKSALGNHKAAMDELADILGENNNLLDVQIEAARAYQAWGDADKSGFHQVAYLGGRRNSKTGEKLIWGWGKIANTVASVLSSKPELAEQFYLARYELARSRYKYALGLPEGELKSKELAQSEKDISSTAALYPELGGPVMKRKYDTLLKVIQKTLGKPQQGLAALK